MDSARFLLAVILMIAVMVLTNIFFPPRRPPQPDVVADTAATRVEPIPSPAPGRADTPGLSATPSVPPADSTPTALSTDTIFVASDLYRFGFSQSGALLSAELRAYESFADSVPEGAFAQLAPMNGDGLLRPRLRFGDTDIDLAELPLTAERADSLVVGESGNQLAFGWSDASGARTVRLVYTFLPETYSAQARVELTGFGAPTPLLLLDLPATLRTNEADPREDERSLAYVVNSPREGISNVRLASIDEPRVENGPFSWVAVKNKYFVVAAMQSPTAPMPFGGLVAEPRGNDTAELTTTLPAGSDGSFAFDLYIGPQEANRLAALGNGLQDVNPYGWRIFRPMLRPLGHAISWALAGMHDVLGIGYGWVLIIFGVLIRIILWPLNARSMRSQLKNMEMQPRIKQIQEQYKGDPQKMQQEMMRLYKEGFNPMGGCVPLLIPFPVLIALFFVFQSTIAFRGVEFLWLPDLSRHDPLYILPVLLGASMFAQQWVTARSTPESMQNPQMKMMMYFMPVFMTVIFLRFASGLNLYYVAQNIASVPQQLQLMRERQRYHAAKKT